MARGGDWEDVLRPVRAEFDSGPCELCDAPVEEGQRIVRVDGEWVHATCAEEEGHEVDTP